MPSAIIIIITMNMFMMNSMVLMMIFRGADLESAWRSSAFADYLYQNHDDDDDDDDHDYDELNDDYNDLKRSGFRERMSILGLC